MATERPSITRLTDDQRDALDRYRSMWLEVGRACGPCDVEATKEAVADAYAAAGLRPPRHVIVTAGPVTGAMCDALVYRMIGERGAGGLVTNRILGLWPHFRRWQGAWKELLMRDVAPEVRGEIHERLFMPLQRCIRDNLRVPVDEAGEALFLSSSDDLDTRLWHSVGRSLEPHQILDRWRRRLDRAKGSTTVWRAAITDTPPRPEDLPACQHLIHSFEHNVSGPHDAGKMAVNAYLAEVCGFRPSQWCEPLVRLSKCAGRWIPRKNICVVQHRPDTLHLDESDRLHNESGMAIRYSDGWGVWAIDGVVLDEQIVMCPGTQTIEQIIQEENEEVRRLRIDRFGWPRFVKTSNARLLDARTNPIENTKEMLYIISGDGISDDMMVFLVCHCPSQGKIFGLHVPPDVATCREAQEFLHGGSRIDELIGSVRTIGRS